MPYVVTQSCCSDASCVYACPVNCIHPTPDEPDFLMAEMLHVDPAACVECGACVSACPVDAIVPHSKLAPSQQRFVQINADFYLTARERPLLAPPVPAAVARIDREPLRVAIVGSGPAAMYAADEILTQQGARVDVYERLDRPYGLARFGVAPDHQRTRQVGELFDMIAAQPGLTLYTGVEVGSSVRHDELLAGHHAVIYAVGASSDKGLGLPGENLPGCASATDFVGWYNGHPDRVDDTYDLSGARAVVVGNGNVALDVARILTVDPATLAGTDIAPSALDVLRSSGIDEVVLLARRGPAPSAFTVPEFVGLIETAGVEVVVDAPAGWRDLTAPDHATRHKLALLRELPDVTVPRGTGRRIVLSYQAMPTAVLGSGRVVGVRVARTELVNAPDGGVGACGTDEVRTIPAGLVLTSVGYHGVKVPDLPFEPASGTVPNVGGRVVDEAGTPVPGSYVTGWIKRGPTGFIGTNKSCAQETVRALVDDFNAGLL